MSLARIIYMCLIRVEVGFRLRTSLHGADVCSTSRGHLRLRAGGVVP